MFLLNHINVYRCSSSCKDLCHIGREQASYYKKGSVLQPASEDPSVQGSDPSLQHYWKAGRTLESLARWEEVGSLAVCL